MHETETLVIGGGIVGLAFAWEAARQGRQVTILERSPAARGATVRNFGMVWPIGQPAGKRHALAMASRRRWLELRDAAGVWVGECGSLHAATEPDELAVLEEFAKASAAGEIDCELLAGPEAVARFPTLAPGVIGALWSPTELVVDATTAAAVIAVYLAVAHGVDIRFDTPVLAVDMPEVSTADGSRWRAEEVIVCGGADFQLLFPEAWKASGMRRCKLQMMRTPVQPRGWRMGPHLAGGLTLTHYPAFAACPSLPALRQRFTESLPHHVAAGIHVMASQNAAGEVILGDSHDLDTPESPFDDCRIDELILDYAHRFMRLPDWRIATRWHGIYARPAEGACSFFAEPQPGCTIVGSPGGAGMTLAFGLAEAWWDTRGPARAAAGGCAADG